MDEDEFDDDIEDDFDGKPDNARKKGIGDAAGEGDGSGDGDGGEEKDGGGNPGAGGSRSFRNPRRGGRRRKRITSFRVRERNGRGATLHDCCCIVFHPSYYGATNLLDTQGQRRDEIGSVDVLVFCFVSTRIL